MTSRTAASPPPTAAPPRSTARLLLDRDFGGLFWGKVISIVGVWAFSVATAIAVFDATGSTLAVGVVAGAQFVPQLVLAPLSGTWADRGDPRRQIILGRLLCLIGAGGLAAWVQLVEPAGWDLAVAVLLGSLTVGFGFSIGGPAMQSVTPRLVSRDELPRAMGLNTAPMTVARVAGPVVGASLVATLGPAAGIAVAALGQLAFLVLLVFVRIPRNPPRESGTDYSVRAAWRHVRSDPGLLLLLLAVTAVTFGAEPSITLAPALAADLGSGAHLVGALTATFGLGSAVGLALVTWLSRPERTIVMLLTGLGCLTAGMGAAAALPWVAGAMAGFAIAGAGFTIGVTSVSTAVLLRVPDYLRGRVMAFWMICFVGFRPVASTLAGTVADAASVRWAILATVLVTAAAMVAITRQRALVSG
ncbi:MFS transporter [Pseudactinotalea sp.]|uniref:MFS transporter n=1 Tax=Pseudactinotalea sp. TaxID=1926260 RepID=UPI003B3A40E4